ncbi:HEPN domain-containing protein [Alicyclobacillus sp. SO9]|uniref:HEPN domain-containing protein n=1 Tax=Alicyclobacillus sp. SO9 TaxID=2665646 RepID=UPI0018E83E85|nr:HEPN domain-containing protein [Alicyclobacillus sp. SO9]QQE77283.1 hypothetical protein GI364_15090 [Alicyclobacillus sp. SO9]
MQKKKRLTPYLFDVILSMKETRDEIDRYCVNFLRNVSRYSIFMHSVLQDTPKDKDFLLVPVSQYIVSLVGCLETFLRDTFVFLLNNQPKFYMTICTFTQSELSEHPDDDVADGVTHAEFISQMFNFQNLKDIESAFSPLCDGGEFISAISEFQLKCVVARVDRFTIFSLDQFFSVRSTLNDILKYRHRIIHDANYRPTDVLTTIPTIESLMVFLPQMITFWIHRRSETPYMSRNDDESDLSAEGQSTQSTSLPYLFTVSDLIADDWIPVE